MSDPNVILLYVSSAPRSADFYGGFNVFPIDLEGELLRDDRVAEAAVIGMPSDKWGETPVGFVVLKGADEAAGSCLNLLSIMGIIDPQSVPHITMPINEKKMVVASKSQCGP